MLAKPSLPAWRGLGALKQRPRNRVRKPRGRRLRHPREVRVGTGCPHACRAAAISECSCGFLIGVRRKIFAVEYDQVEGAEDYIRGVLLAHQVKPLLVEKDLGLDGA
jgi:hypothetical protein